MLAVLLCTVAVYFTKEFFEKEQKRFLLFSLGCLLMVVFIYQLMLGLFVVMCLPFVVKYSDNWKSFVKNNILVAMLYIMLTYNMKKQKKEQEVLTKECNNYNHYSIKKYYIYISQSQ